MDFTVRMASLLGAMRRERNGAVADTMCSYGKRCGLNWGVSLPTVRQIARSETPDHDFARYLWQQDVRELRLAALHLAQPECLVPEEFACWAAGIVDSELAEEAAFALLSRTQVFPVLFDAWMNCDNPLLQYAALMAASRVPQPHAAWIVPAVDAVRRAAVVQAVVERAAAVSVSDADKAIPVGSAVATAAAIPAIAAAPAPYAAHLVAQGAVALLAAFGSRNEENRQAVLRATGSLGKLPTEDFIHEELAWRL